MEILFGDRFIKAMKIWSNKFKEEQPEWLHLLVIFHMKKGSDILTYSYHHIIIIILLSALPVRHWRVNKKAEPVRCLPLA